MQVAKQVADGSTQFPVHVSNLLQDGGPNGDVIAVVHTGHPQAEHVSTVGGLRLRGDGGGEGEGEEGNEQAG